MANNYSQNYSDYDNYSQADQFYREHVQNQRINNILDESDGTPPPLFPTPIRAQEDLRQDPNHLTPSTSFHSEPGTFQSNNSYRREDFELERFNYNNESSISTLLLQNDTSSQNTLSQYQSDSYQHFSNTPYEYVSTFDLYSRNFSNITNPNSQKFSNSPCQFHFDSDTNDDYFNNRDSILSRSSSFVMEPDLKPAHVTAYENYNDDDPLPSTQPSYVRYGAYLASLNDSKAPETHNEN
jgi:hypothetical protein